MKRINQMKSVVAGWGQLEGRSLEALSEPIVCLGPGGDFVTQIVADEMGEMIFVSQNSGDAPTQTLQFVEQPIDWLERLFGIAGRLVGHTVQESPLQENGKEKNPRAFAHSSLTSAISTTLISTTLISTTPISTTPARALDMIRDGMFRKSRIQKDPIRKDRGRTAPPPTVYVYRRVAETLLESHETQRKNQQNESDTQTNADLQLRSPVQSDERILPDSAGNSGRTRREQSHRVRTCAGTRRERRTEAQSEQGSLFI